MLFCKSSVLKKYAFRILMLNSATDSNMSSTYLLFEKGKVHPCTGHEIPERKKIQLYPIFNLGARCKWVVNTTPQPPYSRNSNSTDCKAGCETKVGSN
jgi:hypothetical protein